MVSARIVDAMVGPSFGPRRVLADPGLGALLMNACVANGVMSVFTNAVFGAIGVFTNTVRIHLTPSLQAIVSINELEWRPIRYVHRLGTKQPDIHVRNVGV
jgi:hypothetical protein